jgi:hypothetical protein
MVSSNGSQTFKFQPMHTIGFDQRWVVEANEFRITLLLSERDPRDHEFRQGSITRLGPCPNSGFQLQVAEG